jgi:hypothetical protein
MSKLVRRFQVAWIPVLPILVVVIGSCAGGKPPLDTLPYSDQTAAIVYFDEDRAMVASSWSGIGDAPVQRRELLDTEQFHSWIANLFGGHGRLRPSVSPTSTYVVADAPGISQFEPFTPSDVDISIYNVRNNSVALNLEVQVPKPEYQREDWAIPWSRRDDGFFAVRDNTLYKFYPDGREVALLAEDDLYAFSVSPGEDLVLVHHGGRVDLHRMGTGAVETVLEVGKALGMQRKYVRGMTWSPGSHRVAFAENRNLYVLDLQSFELTRFDAKGKVFDIEWLSNAELLYVRGEYPSDYSNMQSDRYFEIVHLNIATGQRTSLHKRVNHEPFSVKLKRSPSAQLVLFAEKKLNGPYEVKVMRADGRQMITVAEGMYPQWRR